MESMCYARISPPDLELYDDDIDFGLSDGVEPPRKKKAKLVDRLHGLISLQDFEGYWFFNAELCHIIGVRLAKVNSAVTKLNVDEKWLATALVVRYFEKRLADDKDTWELVVEKAREWLVTQGCDEKSEVWTVGILE